MANPQVTQHAIDELLHRKCKLMSNWLDDVSGNYYAGWFYRFENRTAVGANIWLAPTDDPCRALRALNTLQSFLTTRD